MPTISRLNLPTSSLPNYHQQVSDIFLTLGIDREDVLEEVRVAFKEFSSWFAWCEFWEWDVDLYEEMGVTQ